MDSRESELYQRLAEFELDDPASDHCFSDKLAKANRWSTDYARRTVEEYKRFLFLAVTAGHIVTPSDQVDQAWHQHLTYTESYWKELCAEVLGQEIHHGPSKGGADETRKYRELYEQTLDSYRAAFGEEPPEDIWPDTNTRFGSDLACCRVNTSQNWVIPKPAKCIKQLLRPLRQETLALGVVPLVFAAWNPFDLRGPEFMVLFGLSYVFSVAIAITLRSTLRRVHPQTIGRPPETLNDPYEVAYLAGGESRVAQAATGLLVHSGVFEVQRSSKTLVANLPLPSSAHEIEEAVYSAAVATNGKAEGRHFSSFAGSALTTIRNSLAEKGLIETASSFAAAQFWSLVVMCPVLVLGVVKLNVGLSRQKPVGFLIAGLVVVVATMVWFAIRRPHRTAAGNRLLGQLTGELRSGDRVEKVSHDGGLEGSDLAYGIALLGLTTALPATDPTLKLFTTSKASSFGGCGISDAGGGCGGGGCSGGGCGGCGG